MAENKVLIEFRERQKILRLCGDGRLDDLKTETLAVYDDIVKKLEGSYNLIFQIKSHEWDGTFIDLEATEIIPDKAIVRLIIEPVQQVS